ncbi:MAG: hypothetical protein AMJ81_07870 [Phycisphaerae bacterium SM23_33]|nr:MAG: hypothetical protein AMJ81_07870 [Phycisphaerae bacterium SM23_33]
MGPGASTALVEAVGDIDMQRSADFQRGLMEVLDRRPRQIVVDLSGVAYMDSSGVASLVKLLARVRREKIGLRLAGLTSRVRSVFEITRLDSVFDIFGSAQEALQP